VQKIDFVFPQKPRQNNLLAKRIIFCAASNLLYGCTRKLEFIELFRRKDQQILML